MHQYSIRFTFDGQDYFANFDNELSALQIEMIESGDFVAGNAALAGTALTALFHMRAVEHWGNDGNAEFFDSAIRADQTFRAAIRTAETNSWWSDAGEVAGGSLASAAGSVQAGAPVAVAVSVIPGLGLPAAGVSLGLTATTSALAGGVTAALTVSARNADIAYNGMLGTFGGSLNADLINYFMKFVADVDVDPETGARRIGELRPITDTDTEITWSDFNTQSASAIANLYTVAAMAGEIERVEGNLPQTDLWQSYVDSFAASLITSKDPTGISGAVLGSARSVFDLHARDGRPESFEAFIASIESHIDSRVSEVTSELRGLLNNAGQRGFTYIGTDSDDRFVVGADSSTIYTLGGRNEVLAPEGGSHSIIGGSGDLSVSLELQELGQSFRQITGSSSSRVASLGGINTVRGSEGFSEVVIDISEVDMDPDAPAAWRPVTYSATGSVGGGPTFHWNRLTPEGITFSQAEAFANEPGLKYLWLDETPAGSVRMTTWGTTAVSGELPTTAFRLTDIDRLHYEGGAGDDVLIPFGPGITRAIGGGGTNTLYVDWRDLTGDVVWDLNTTLEDETELANGWTVQGIHRLLGYMGDGDHDITFHAGDNHIVAGDGNYRLTLTGADNHIVGGDGDYHVRGNHGGDRLDLAASRNADISLRDMGNGNTIIGGSGDLSVSLELQDLGQSFRQITGSSSSRVASLGGINTVYGSEGFSEVVVDISQLDMDAGPLASWRPVTLSASYSVGGGPTFQWNRLTPEGVTLSQAEAFANEPGLKYLWLDETPAGSVRMTTWGTVAVSGELPTTAFRLTDIDKLHYEGGAGDDVLIPFGPGITRAIGGGGTNTLYVDWRDLTGDVVWDLNTTLEDETELANGWTVQGIHRLLGYMGDGDYDITFHAGDNHIVAGDGDYHVRGAHGGDRLNLSASRNADIALRDLGNGNEVTGGSGDLAVSLGIDALGGTNVVRGGEGHSELTLDISALDVGEMAAAAWRPLLISNWGSGVRRTRLDPETITLEQAETFALGTRTANFSLMAEGERWLYLDNGTGHEGATGTQVRTFDLDRLHYEGGAGDDLLILFGNDVTRAIGGGGTNTVYVDWRDFVADVIWDLNTTLEDETELANGWTVQGVHRLLGYMGDGDYTLTFAGGGNQIVAGDGDYRITLAGAENRITGGDGDYHVRGTHGGDRLNLSASRNADIALRDLGNGNEVTGGSGDLAVSLGIDALGGTNVVRGGEGHSELTLDISALDVGEMAAAAWRPLLISNWGSGVRRTRLDPETITLEQAETFALGTRTANFSLMAEGERWLYLDDGTGAEGATGTQIRTFNLDTLNYIGGDGNDLMIGLGGDEFFRGGLGNDVVVLNGGSNRIIGTLEELHGDRILDLTTRDVIVVEGIELADHNVAFDTAETRLIITPEGSEIAFHIDLYGEFIPEAFEVTVVGEISEIRYLGEIAPDPTLLPNLDLSAIQDGPVIEGRVFDIDTGFSVLSVNGMPVKEDSLHDGTLGTLQISDDGVFSYNPDMAVHLPEGERQDDLFTLVVSNSVGDTSELVIRASVTGVNDPASISGDSTGIVVEDDPERVQVAGVLTVTDPDAGEDRFRAPEPGALQGTFGTFAFDPETGAWTYTLDNDLDAVQALPEGGEVTDSLTVTSLDGTASETITVTIRGANDPASIAGESTGLVVEDDADRAQATGVLSVTDPDAGEDRFAEIDPAALAGDYGAFAFDPESGVWTYTLDNDLDAVQALPEGAEVTDSLSVTSLDGTASETITVTIRGTNDPASIAGDSTGLVVEDDVARQTTTGVLTVTDPDAGEDRFAEIDPAALAGDYGAFAFDPESGAWTYTLDNDADAVQALPEGAEVTDSLTVTSFDSTASETITVTILGADVATPEPNGTIMPQSAIQGRSGETLDGMTVTFTPDDGSTAIDIANTAEGFDLATAASASGRITASRDYIPETDGNVTALDALNVLRLAVGLSPSWGPASPMDFIAADINQDGQVTALDALEVLRAAVGLQSVNQPRWFFMDSEADLSHINRNDTLVEEGIRFDPAVTDISSLSMTGVLLGSMQEYAQ